MGHMCPLYSHCQTLEVSLDLTDEETKSREVSEARFILPELESALVQLSSLAYKHSLNRPSNSAEKLPTLQPWVSQCVISSKDQRTGYPLALPSKSTEGGYTGKLMLTL